ncbi:MAG: hypothetical protein KBA31_16410 [Alphaproteobacteria bacterium]|nr:hypothetical protein [Alphaproteobacteria bacterium]
MRKTTLALIALAVAAGTAQARSTQAFLDMCASDEVACAREIKDARRALEQGPRERLRICIPPGMSDDGLVGEVTHWISERSPELDREEAAESIAAALVALYSCDRPRSIDLEGN